MNRLVLTAALVCAAPASAQVRYFSAVEDLPLAPSLSETAPGFWFEDAEGRILSVIARGAAPPDAVRRFYLDTLPALGWSFSPGADVDSELVFLRGRERLALTVSPRGDGAELELRLFVGSAATNAD